MAGEDEKLRADARANRDCILDVARQAFAADPQVSMSAIARTAGVGAGTLYRHFSSREALVLAVFRREIDALVILAPALLAEQPPLPAFRRWCDRLAQFGRAKHGVADAFHAALSEKDIRETYWPVVGAIRQLITACEASGDIRPDTDPEDFLLLLACLWRIPATSAGEVQAERLLKVVFRGLGAEDMPSDDVPPS